MKQSSAMNNNVRMISAELDGDDGLLVTFSDGTIAGYVVEEMLDLRPKREPSAPRKTPVTKDLQ